MGEEEGEFSLPLARFVFNLCVCVFVFQNGALKYERAERAYHKNIAGCCATGYNSISGKWQGSSIINMLDKQGQRCELPSPLLPTILSLHHSWRCMINAIIINFGHVNCACQKFKQVPLTAPLHVAHTHRYTESEGGERGGLRV